MFITVYILFYYSWFRTLIFQQMDISINGETSRSSSISSHSFNKTINHLFSTATHPKPSVLAQLTSCKMKNMVRHSCHIMFLLQCRDHDFIPKGLTIKDPVGSSESSKTLHHASMTLVKQQLKQCRTTFAKEKKAYDSTMATLKQLLDTSYFNKLSELHMTHPLVHITINTSGSIKRISMTSFYAITLPLPILMIN